MGGQTQVEAHFGQAFVSPFQSFAAGCALTQIGFLQSLTQVEGSFEQTLGHALAVGAGEVVGYQQKPGEKSKVRAKIGIS